MWAVVRVVEVLVLVGGSKQHRTTSHAPIAERWWLLMWWLPIDAT